MSDAMENFYKVRYFQLKSQIDRIMEAYCDGTSNDEFVETVYHIITEDLK